MYMYRAVVFIRYCVRSSLCAKQFYLLKQRAKF